MRKTLAIIMMIAMVFCYMPLTGFADTEVSTTSVNTSGFIDMPNNWSTEALSKAVGNGLLEGFKEKSGTFIKPSDPLTRAQMATIVNRAFGAKGTANLTGVKDVPQKAWYTAEMQKAVKMGTMKLDSKMRPNDSITRQEAFTILARAFKMTDGTATDLAGFSDGSKVASWAVPGMGALVKAGYVQGSDNMLTPTAQMTRAQFAVIMNNMIQDYITQAGTVTAVASGNVMVNVPGVTLKDVTIQGDLIVGDGVGDGDVTLDNVTIKGDLIARGGGVNSIIIVGGGVDGKIVIAKVDGQVRVSVEGGAEVEVIVIDDGKDDVIIEGTVGTVEVTAPDTPVIVQNATVTNIEIKSVGAANVTVASGSTVTNVVVGTGSTGTTLNVEGRVTNVETSAANTNVGGTGTVTTVTTNEGANNTSVTTPSTKVNNDGATGVTAGGGTEVPSGSTATNSNTGGEATVQPTTGGGGSTGSGSGSGDTVLAVDKTALTSAIDAEYSDGAARTTYALTEVDYTGATWTAYTTAIADAIVVEADGDANQAAVDAAAGAIATAKGNLVFAGQAGLDAAKGTAAGLTEGDYTVGSWAVLTTALALPETTNAEVVAKTTAINSAIENLQLILSYNGSVSGQITSNALGVVNGTLDFEGEDDLIIQGNVTGTGNLTTFTGTVLGSINGTITAQINANGIDTLSGTITPSSGVVDGTIRIIGIFGQTGIDGDFEGEIITGPVPTYVETLEITSAAGSTVTVGHTLQLGINVTPEGASAEVAWSVYVNDKEKGSIDENGLFTGEAAGNVTVIVKALDGSLKDDTFTVTVQTLETAAIAAINAGGATLQDYENAGIIGVSAGNLTDVNTSVATAKATKESDLIKEEIQGVVASVVDAADQLLLARVNASQLRITLENGAVDTIGDMLTEYFGLDAIGESLTETISLFWFDNYHYQNKFTFASLEAVVSALSAVETEYAKIIATFQGTEGGYATNVEAVESYIASAARLAATSSSPGRTVADEIVELAPMYAAGIIGADNLINDAYEEMMNGIDGTGIDTLAEFFAAFQAALEAASGAASGD